MKDIAWTEAAIQDMSALDKGTPRRIKQAIERFAQSGTGNIKQLQGINPPEFRLRAGDYRVRFHSGGASITILRVRNRREGYR